MDVAAAPKGKRRQHVACDACKLRRIKCDLVNLLPSRLDDPGNEHLPSFREQVRRHPEVQCANCVKKELICSTEAIRNPAPPKKTGRMIDKLRERSQRSQQGWTGQGPLEEMEDSSESDDEYDDAPERSGSRGKQPLEPNQSREQLLAELLDSRAGRDEMAAYASWRSMIENLPSVTANAPALPLPATVHLDDITIGHGSRGHGAIVAPASSINVSAPFSSWMTSGTGAHCPSTVPVRYADSFGIGVYGRSMEAESSTSHSRKRRFGGLGQVLELSGEPREWHLWSREDSLVVWGRREIVQERLADRALGMELSRHLISMYFQVVHHAFPAVNPESFYVEWMRAGQRSDQMSPSQEALCAVLEAWGAQYSDNPVVLGLTGTQRPPTVWKKDGTTNPIGQIRWGVQRMPVCRALAARAARLIDYNGLYRRPTISGIQALLIYSMLANVANENSGRGGYALEANTSLSVLVDQMTFLNLMWDSPGDIPADPAELPLTKSQLRNKQRQVFWSVMVTDALNAADNAQMPKIPQADIEAAGRWVNVVQKTLPLSSFKLVAFFMQCFHRLAVIARRIALELAVLNLRPGSVDVPTFCRSVREQWAEIKALHREIGGQSTEIMEQCASTMGYGFPLGRLVTLRLACPRMLFLQHQYIQKQLDFRRQLGTRISSPGSDANAGHVALLEELQLQSVDVLLQGCRTHIDMFELILPTGILQTTTLFVRVLVAAALFMAAIPTNEQGYPSDTLGGSGWTWDAKEHNIGICIKALNQLGWAWSNMQNVLDAVQATMDRMAPSAETLASYDPVRNGDERLQARRQIEREEDRKSMNLALSYWPPASVPQLIDSVMAGLDIQAASPAEIFERLTPENLHAKAVQRRHKQEQLRISSGSSAIQDEAMVVDPPSGQVESTPQTGGAGVSAAQQDNPGWGTCLYHLAQVEKTKQAASSGGTVTGSTVLSKTSSNLSSNASGAQTGQTSVSVSQENSPGWGSCMFHFVQSQQNGGQHASSALDTPAAPMSASHPQPLMGTGSNLPTVATSPAKATSLWGIDFALESGLFSQSSGRTPSSGTNSRVASSTPSSVPPPPLSSEALHTHAGPSQASNGGVDHTMSEARIAELEEFLLELDKLSGVPNATTEVAS